ncbi:MAG: hypothetical protein JO041_11565, partial [Acidobacteria bacterium]|nr:hypothetical protein [Acidobacteriota bacterium]
MQKLKFVVFAMLGSLGAFAQAAAGGAPTQSQPATTLQQVIDRIMQREHEQVKALDQYSPIAETYIQNVARNQDQMIVPTSDRYYIGKLSLNDGTFDEHIFTTPQGFRSRLKEKITGRLSLLSVKYNPAGFAYQIFPDQNAFDHQHYDLTFVQREFLGDVRTLVFDVLPKKGSGDGRFLGRIWVEDKEMTIVRFNGTYVPKPRSGMFFHFDSWRVNSAGNLWVPAYVYSEESDALYGLNRRFSMKAQT